MNRESSFSEAERDLRASASLTSVEKEEVYRTDNFRKERSKHERLEGGWSESKLTDTAKAESEMESLKRSSMGLQKEDREKVEERTSVDALLAFKEAKQQFVESKTSVSEEETSLSQIEQHIKKSDKTAKASEVTETGKENKTEKKKVKATKKSSKKVKSNKNKTSSKNLTSEDKIKTKKDVAQSNKSSESVAKLKTSTRDETISLENKSSNKTQIESNYQSSTLKKSRKLKRQKNKPKIETEETSMKTEESKDRYEKTIEQEVEPIVTQQSDEEVVVEESHQSFIEIDEVTDESECDQSYVSTPSKVEYCEDELWQGVNKSMQSQDSLSTVEFSVIGEYPVTPKPTRAPENFAPCFKKSLTARSCFESEAAEFTCQVEGFGLVRWTVNDVEVRPAQVGYSILVDDVY